VGELDQLWTKYARKRTPELRQAIIEAYAPLARYVVDRLNLKPGPALEYDDLLGQAVVGLIDAAERFDPSRGIKFETYAYHRIRGAVMDMLRELDWLPRSVRQRESELTAAYQELEERLGRAPTDEELARKLAVTVDELDALAHEVALQAMQSLDETVTLQDWEAGTIGEMVADVSTASPEEALERRAERDLVARGIEALPQAERTVISLYYYEGLTLKEIGKVLGVTESRACQIHGKAVVRLRAHVQAELKGPAVRERLAAGQTRSAAAARLTTGQGRV